MRGGWIESQTEGEVSRIRYGLFPMSFNGCEIIAVYNALRSLGRESGLEDLICLFRRERLMLAWGLFGSRVFRLGRVFSALGISFRRVRLEEVREDGIYVISFWNRGLPFHGIHTVMTRIEGGRPLTPNLYCDVRLSRESPASFAGRRYITGYQLSDRWKSR